MTGSSLPRRASSVRSRPYFVERLVFGLRVLVGYALRATHLREHFENSILGDVELLQNPRRDAASPFAGDGQQQMLGADELVFQPLGFAFGGFGHLSQVAETAPGCDPP